MAKTKQRPATTEAIKKALTAAQIPEHLQENVLRGLQPQYYPPVNVRCIPIKEGWITGYILPWTDAFHLNKYGVYFDKARTSLRLKSAYATMPILWGHGTDEFKDSVGTVFNIVKDARGALLKSARIDLSMSMGRKCWDLALKNKLYYSPAAIPSLALAEPDGLVTQYAINEVSLTTSPAGPKHAADHYARAEYLAVQNHNYRLKAVQSLMQYGLNTEAVQEIISVLPNPFEQ